MVLLLACASDDDSVDCTSALPEPNWFEIGFFNSQGEPLIGTVYQQEEFRLFNSKSEIFISPMPFGDPTRLQVRFPDVDSVTEYYIELTEIDTDTLSFTYETLQGPCFLSYDLTQVNYNGETFLLKNTDRVDFIK
ncbi:hypothetical protein [Sediminicola sp. YIK13]|uniref:hypothetical protein n=1 Tax=Sediminicola sp. YIK13 TaxID=1453352 RepID=UPI0011A3FF74|nr:hypothetical protein [Sediminicola sp. YIK13]